MKQDWAKRLKVDPLPPLLSGGDEAVEYFSRRDLLNEKVAPSGFIRDLPEVKGLIYGQQPDGSWKGRSKDLAVYPPGHPSLVETFKRFRLLVNRYQMDNSDIPVRNAADYLFSFQAPSGDIRGMLANQYATYYTGLILALLIRAGYQDDPRVERGLRWLLSMRQDDGGWTIPILTGNFSRDAINHLTSRYAEPFEGDRTRPFSHNWTNMVLQAFAAHPRYRGLKEVKKAAELLKSRFFQADSYTSYQAAAYWTRFLFWWPNLLTALESLLSLGYRADDPDISLALSWFVDQQKEDGLWDLEYGGERGNWNSKTGIERLWLSLAICRMLKKAF